MEIEFFFDSKQLLNNPDVKFKFGPVINTSIHEMAHAGWRMTFRQRTIFTGSVRYTRPRIRFYDPNNPGTALSIRIVNGHTTFLDSIPQLWEAMETRAAVGNVHKNYKAVSDRVISNDVRTEIEALNHRIMVKKREIDNLNFLLDTKNQEIELLRVRAAAAVVEDELTAIKRFNDERLAKLDQSTIDMMAQLMEDRVVKLVVNNDLDAEVARLLSEAA